MIVPMIWGFPDIPSPSDLIENLGDLIVNANTYILELVVQMILYVATPSSDLIESDAFAYLLGSWLSTGQNLFSFVVIIVGIVIALRFNSNNSKRYSRLITTAVLIAFAIRLFYPAYAALYELSREVSAFVQETVGEGGSNADFVDALASTSTVPNIVLNLMAAFFIVIGAILLGIVSLGIFLTGLSGILWWPVTLALRPLGGPFVLAFNVANGMIATAIISPPIMVFWLSMSIRATREMNDILPTASGIIGMFALLLAVLLAAVTPIAVFFIGFSVSKNVQGKVDASIAGSVDITASQPLSVQEATANVEQDQSSFLKEAATSAAIATIDDRPGESAGYRLADIAATTAASTGHPGFAVAAQVVKRSLPNAQTNIDQSKTDQSETEGD